MSSRNRPRNGVAKEEFADAHEESTMWQQIKKDIEKLGTIQKRQMELTQEIQDVELAYSRSKPSPLRYMTIYTNFICCSSPA